VRAQSGGFSLVELLAVVAILSILASIGLPLMELSARRNQEEDLRRSLREIREALDQYKLMADRGRISQLAGASGYPPNLEVLSQGVIDAQSPHGAKLYFLRAIPRDPMAPSGLPSAESWALRSYSSPPDNPQAGEDVFDVHSKSGQVGLNGVAYSEW
jgi:general secretion pathway protein G